MNSVSSPVVASDSSPSSALPSRSIKSHGGDVYDGFENFEESSHQKHHETDLIMKRHGKTTS